MEILRLDLKKDKDFIIRLFPLIKRVDLLNLTSLFNIRK